MTASVRDREAVKALEVSRSTGRKRKECEQSLFSLMRRNPKISSLVRKLSFNAPCVERDDIKAEFWRGVLLGMKKVKHDIGNPVSYLIQSGIWQVKSKIRDEIRQRIVQSCNSCGHHNGTYSYERKCERCGQDVENIFRSVLVEDVHLEYVGDENTNAQEVESLMQTKFKPLVEALYGGCMVCPPKVSPVSFAARNLGISRQRVHVLIGKLKKELTRG